MSRSSCLSRICPEPEMSKMGGSGNPDYGSCVQWPQSPMILAAHLPRRTKKYRVSAGLPELPIFEISGSGFRSRLIPAPAPYPYPYPQAQPQPYTHTQGPVKIKYLQRSRSRELEIEPDQKKPLRLQPKRAAPAPATLGFPQIKNQVL